jgi:hypothetical protein
VVLADQVRFTTAARVERKTPTEQMIVLTVVFLNVVGVNQVRFTTAAHVEQKTPIEQLIAPSQTLNKLVL